MKFLFILFFALLHLPGFCQEDDDKLLQELEAKRLEQLEMAIKLDQSRQQLENSTYNAADELKKAGHDTIDAASLMDDKVVAIIQKGMKDSQVYNQSPEWIRAMLMGKVKGTPWEKFFQKFPLPIDIMVDIIRSREALPSMIGLFSRKKDLKTYFYIWLALMISGFLIKKYVFPKKWKGGKRFLAGITLSLGLTLTTFCIFYYMFEKEISPAVKIVGIHLGLS